MEAPEFKEFTKSMVDFIVDYWENIRDRDVLPAVEPGYLRPLLPEEAPLQPEQWQDVMKDIDRVIMPGITHWMSPHFHAYYPMSNSYPSIVADMLSDGLGCLAFSWIASPAATELEVVMMDWLGKMINLPADFLVCSGSKGGGIIQGSASEATFIALLGAKAKKILAVREEHPDWDDDVIVSKLVAYCSTQTHSSGEKACLLAGVKLRILSTDGENKLRGPVLEAAIKEDLEAGLIPFYSIVTFGTTNSCAFDCLDECGPVANKHNVWIHVDAAYAGSAFICPEYRHLMKGIEMADSFNFNPHKWMLVNFECSAMWLKNSKCLVNSFNVDPVYLKYDKKGSAPDYRHWQIPLSRRFRALKLWFVLRLHGVEYLQAHIRRHCAYAQKFENCVRADNRFEITNQVTLALVCFRLKGSNELNEALLKLLNQRRHVHIVATKINGVYVLRFVISSQYTTAEDVEYAWREIQTAAQEILQQVTPQPIYDPKPKRYDLKYPMLEAVSDTYNLH